MNTDSGTLSFDAWIDNSNFKRQIDEMTQRLTKLGDTAQKEGTEIDSTFKKVGLAIGTYFSGQMLLRFGMAVKDVRGEFEQMGVALEVMLGSKERADKLMSQIVELAAKTPFTLQQVGGLSKQLLAFGESEETVIDTVRRLGDVAAGTGTEVNGLGLAYGQVMTKGKLMSQEMYQFAERGVPLIAELANMFGVTSKNIMKMVEEGAVGFTDVQKAIINMTSEGGKFNNMMEKQSKTVTGLWSNMQDAWSQMQNSIGESNEGIIKGAIIGITDLIKNYEGLLNVIGSAIAIFGTYKAAVMLVSVAQRVHMAVMMQQATATKAMTTWEALHAVLLKKVTVAQALLNKTMLANPYVLLITALGSLVALLVIFRDKTTAAEKAQKDFADRQQQMADAAEQNRTEMERLLGIVTDVGRAEFERVAALGELQKKYPEIFAQYDIETIKLADILELKKKIAEQEGARQVAENQGEMERLQGEIKILEEKLAAWEPDPYDQTGADITYQNDLIKQLAIAREELKLWQKKVQEDRVNIVTTELKSYTDAQIQSELAAKQKVLEALKSEGGKEAVVTEGLFVGTFDEAELKRQTALLQTELDNRNVAVYSYNELLKKYEDERIEQEKKRLQLMQGKEEMSESPKILSLDSPAPKE